MPYLFKHYRVVVQEVVRNDFLAMHAELPLSLELEETIPKAIFYHCSNFLIGNKKYNRGEMKREILEQMAAAKERIDNADAVLRSGNKAPPKLIWSRTVSCPFLASKYFSSGTLLNAVKTINSEVALTLREENKEIGIVKHCQIFPNSNMFQPDNQPTVNARLIFLESFNVYIRELDVQERREQSHIKAGVPLRDNTAELKIRQIQKEKDNLNKRIENLEQELVETKRGNIPARHDLRIMDSPRRRQNHTWGRRNERNRKASPNRRAMTESRCKRREVTNFTESSGDEEEHYQCFQRFEAFERKRKRDEQHRKDDRELRGDRGSRRQLSFFIDWGEPCNHQCTKKLHNCKVNVHHKVKISLVHFALLC